LKPTVGVEFLTKVMKIQGSNVKITFWDTAGQERYKYLSGDCRSLSKVYYKGAAGIIIVYDITQPQTYTNVESWMRLASIPYLMQTIT
jgi:GTPase SAR1 family protein